MGAVLILFYNKERKQYIHDILLAGARNLSTYIPDDIINITRHILEPVPRK
jgi:hypothetical protein